MALCQQALGLGPQDDVENSEGDSEDEDGGSGGGAVRSTAVYVPPPSLSSDLGGALGDSSWSDVKFVAGGRPIHAHRCVLTARSSYFAAMFRSGMQEGASGRTGVLDVVVPDSHVGMLRLLLFLYSGTLALADHTVLLEDLVAADRYNLIAMKRLCESMISVTAENAVEVYRIASMVDAPRLQTEALSFMASHLADVGGTAAFRRLCDADASLRASILERAMASASSLASGSSGVQQRVEKTANTAGPGAFPIWASLLALVSAYAYARASTYVSLGPLIPIANTLFFVVLLLVGCLRLRE